MSKELVNWQAEGRISFTTLMTDLLRTDQSILEPPSFPFDNESLDVMFWVLAGKGAAQGDDQSFATNLPRGLGERTRVKLFHERFHYSQLMTYPLLQKNFLMEMEQLRVKVKELKGFPYVLSGQSQSDEVAPREEVTDELQLMAAYISGTAQAGDGGYKVKGVEDVQLLPVSFEDSHRYFRGSAGRLLFGAESQLIPFTAVNLIESAALVAEHLYQGEVPPRMTAPGSDRDVRYLGCWELWCRLHARRFETLREAAEAFLAVADLALSAHVLAGYDQELQEKMKNDAFSAEMRLPHARFFALLVRAPDVEIPKHLEGTAAAAHFQGAFCELVGWPDPQRAYRFMAAFLTQRVLFSSIWSFEKQIKIDEARMMWALGTDLSEVAADLDRLRPVWTSLSQSFASTLEVGSPNVVIGSRVLGKMINSCLVRIEGRFNIAAPHLDPAGLGEHFKLPLIRLGNRYYMDEDFESPDMSSELEHIMGSPIQLPSNDVMTDCIAIAALHPLVDGQTRCGLIDPDTKEPNCMYVAGGAGCPQAGLTPEQAEKRRERGLHDWCHWTHAALRTGTAPIELRQAWIDRWKAASAAPR